MITTSTNRASLVIFAVALSISCGFGQTRNDLQGPKAKNYKPWKDKSKSSAPALIAKDTGRRLMGPAAKNAKPWKINRLKSNLLLVKTDPNRFKMMGPDAKNYQPWKYRDRSGNYGLRTRVTSRATDTYKNSSRPTKQESESVVRDEN